MKLKQLYAAALLTLVACNPSAPDGESQFTTFAPDGIPFVIAETTWDPDMQGNHRAVVSTDVTGAVKAELPWRRADMRPETKTIFVVNAATGKRLDNSAILSLTAEQGSVAFEAPTKGEYYIYYMPYKFPKGYNDARYYVHNDYIAPDSTQSDWAASISGELPTAKVLRFESRSKYDYLTSMGVTATKAEEKVIADKDGGKLVIFTEDRAYPIRLPYTLPYRWVETGARKEFKGTACRNEYYTYQIGLWSPVESVNDVKIEFSDLKNGDATIPKEDITCFNLGGTNWDGSPIAFTVNVPKGKVQAMWCGVDVPQDAKPGNYQGTATVTAEGVEPQTVTVDIYVMSTELADRGDGDLWRHARLRWLNSTIGADNKAVTPYAPMTLSGKQITATDKNVTIGENGLPTQITINDKNILSAPMQFVVETPSGTVPLTIGANEIKAVDDGVVNWTAQGQTKGISYNVTASMEFDGYTRYNVKLSTADGQMVVRNIKLVMQLTPYCSEYFMGAGFAGGARPSNHTWDWSGPYDSFWIGNEKAGLHVELRGGKYHGPLINDYKPAPPVSWSNHSRGGVSVSGAKGSAATVTAFTGADTLTTTPKDFEFGMLITPMKPVDTKKHFSEKYFHADPANYKQAIAAGANIINVHHASKLNPVINYPWFVRDPLIKYIDSMHQENMKVKLYYTIRELTTYTTELYALHSLNHEIFAPGIGYGLAWTCEHMIDDYRPAWYSEIEGQQSDVAIVLSGFSRWINYYLEGYRWMLENYKIDGIYMDDVSFDRTVMKRMRKIMEQTRPGSLIDLHSNTGYSRGPENQYADFIPYIDRTWYGESYRYNELTPDEWFVTFSSIPMGMMSEMLQDGGNPYLGMIYGATGRFSRADMEKSPAPMWKLWSDFGIADAQMKGYWSEDAVICCSNPKVKATAYVRDGKTLVVLGNFDSAEQSSTITIDWQAIGLDQSKAKASMPDLGYMQSLGSIDISAPIKIKAKEAVFFILE